MDKQLIELADEWLTIDCERVLYVDRGINTILCDRLPSPITLVIKPLRAIASKETQS